VGVNQMKFRSKAAHLDKLIEEATVNCYNESEEIGGIFTMMEENLEVPFKTTILGLDVTVEGIDLKETIVAVCRRGRARQRVPILDLPLPEPRPRGAEWIDAYRRWARGR
jgi:hypothetical protein